VSERPPPFWHFISNLWKQFLFDLNTRCSNIILGAWRRVRSACILSRTFLSMITLGYSLIVCRRRLLPPVFSNWIFAQRTLLFFNPRNLLKCSLLTPADYGGRFCLMNELWLLFYFSMSFSGFVCCGSVGSRRNKRLKSPKNNIPQFLNIKSREENVFKNFFWVRQEVSWKKLFRREEKIIYENSALCLFLSTHLFISYESAII